MANMPLTKLFAKTVQPFQVVSITLDTVTVNKKRKKYIKQYPGTESGWPSATVEKITEPTGVAEYHVWKIPGMQTEPTKINYMKNPN